MAHSVIAPRILCIGIPVRDLTFRVETVPVRGSKNSPANVAFTCARLAEVRGEDPHALARQASTNARALLRMPVPDAAPAA